jgi:hypothetical protein
MNLEIKLVLNKDEALVLSEFLARIGEKEDLYDKVFEDKAEQQVLWSLEGQLEKILVEPLYPNYSEIIASARNKIRFPED